MDALREHSAPAATVTPSTVAGTAGDLDRVTASAGGAARELRQVPAAPRRTQQRAA